MSLKSILPLTFALLLAAPAAFAQAPAPAQRAPAAQEGWFAGERGFSGKLAVGPAYRRVFSVDVGLLGLSGALGAQTRSGGWYGTAFALFGRTDGDLPTRQIGVGGTWEAPLELEELHLGVGAQATYLGINRVTTDNVMAVIGFGGTLFASYDVIKTESYSLVLGLAATGDGYPNDDGPFVLGGSLSVGARFF